MASNPAHSPNANESECKTFESDFGVEACPLTTLQAIFKLEAKRITNPIQTAPSTQPAKRAAMIAVKVLVSPAGKSFAHGERNKGYNGARKILEFGLPY